MSAELLKRITERTARVAVIGQGYVGLPLALAIAQSGFRTVGVDVDDSRVEQLRSGRSYIVDVPNQELIEALESNLYVPTTDFSVLQESDVVIICVPTPLRKSKDPDISYITAAVEEIMKYAHSNLLVILESTTYPGTTDELIAQEIESKGLKVGEDVFVCFSPERVDPGNAVYKTRNTPKVIGGVTRTCGRVGTAFYSEIMDVVVPVSTARVAETVKLLENTFRAVNIALVNELALLCERMEIDIWEVIDAASTKPFGFMPFYPGPGIGGHCIPLDPMYLSWKAKTHDFFNRFIELASDINGNMPRYVVTKVSEVLNLHSKAIRGSKVLILGIAYKKDIDDLRESPSLELFRLLRKHGAQVDYCDPLVPRFRDGNATVESVPISAERLASYDCVVLATNHSLFDYEWIAKHSKLILDTRNAFKGIHGDHIIRLGAPMPETHLAETQSN